MSFAAYVIIERRHFLARFPLTFSEAKPDALTYDVTSFTYI